MTKAPATKDPVDWLANGGEMGERIRAFDWASTPIGPIESWSPALRMIVGFLLTNPHPILLWWGPRYISIYNDTYAPILGTKHPGALGQPCSECWTEIWHILEPLIDTPFHGGPATWIEDFVLELHRHAFLDEGHFTVSYSAVPDDTAPGGTGGVCAIVHEITDKVVGERRVVALRDVGACAGEGKTAEEACAAAARTLAPHDKDLPFVLLYLVDADGKVARLAGAAGIDAGGAASPQLVDLDGPDPPWPLSEAIRSETMVVVDDLVQRFGNAVPQGPWSDPPRQAVVVPIRSNIAHELAGLLVAGVSPRLRLDGLYRSFFELLATQLATAIARASRLRRDAKAVVRDSEQRFRTIADTAPVMLWITERDGSCSFVSRSWYEYTGQTEERGLGFGWLDAVHPDDRTETSHVFLAASGRHEPFATDYRLRGADGEYRWAIASGRPRFDGAGTFLGYIGSVVDVHERKTAEAQREQLLRSERAARADAEQANRLKDEFLATLSHELRSPLNAILGWTYVMEREPENAAIVRQGVEVVARSVRVQTALISDLLDMSRIAAGKIRLEIEDVSLPKLVTGSVDAIRHIAEAKGVRVDSTIEPIDDPVRADSTRIEQIVSNLLSNAVKFTPPGGLVRVDLARQGAVAQIVVRDTGVGIRREFLPYVFERFRQAAAPTTRHTGGLGLGLAIVKQLCDLHGGTVGVESGGEGQGATFTVRLPLARTEGAQSPRPMAAEDRALDGVRVLAIDDQAEVRELLKRVLEERNAEVITAASVEEGVRAFEEHKPHVVLCDIGMPGQDGYDFIRKVRETGDGTPALAVTAFAGSADSLRSLRAGYQAHISKPVDFAELVSAVAALAKSAPILAGSGLESLPSPASRQRFET